MKESSQQTLQDESCKVHIDGVHHILGINRELSQEGGSLATNPTQFFTQSDDPFWSNKENLDAIDEIVLAIQRRNELKDMPTFDLGVSQDVSKDNWDDVVGIANEFDFEPDDVHGGCDIEHGSGGTCHGSPQQVCHCIRDK